MTSSSKTRSEAESTMGYHGICRHRPPLRPHLATFPCLSSLPVQSTRVGAGRRSGRRWKPSIAGARSRKQEKITRYPARRYAREPCLRIGANSDPYHPSGGPLPAPNLRPNVLVDRKEVGCCFCRRICSSSVASSHGSSWWPAEIVKNGGFLRLLVDLKPVWNRAFNRSFPVGRRDTPEDWGKRAPRNRLSAVRTYH